MNPTMAAIRDKDDAHPLGVVGWRSEYHAMRAALDDVLALHGPFTGENSAEDYMRAVRAAITAHLDIEPR